ncbi:MAG: lamin tail domain-containing protein [Polyangiales bacterium]
MTGSRIWKCWATCLALLVGGCAREELAVTFACEEVEAGDLVITEVHANPDGSDGANEYIELFNSSGVTLTLDGLTLSSSRSDGGGAKTHRLFDASIAAGDYLVLGNASPESMPAHVDYSYGEALGGLRNSNARLSIYCGERLIDNVEYERTSDGRSNELDGRFAPDPSLNDDASHWCPTPEGVGEITPGSFGTPGAANSRCVVEEIEDGCLEEGVRRAIDSPRPGAVRITEWMANPKGADAEFEWVEALFADETDLNDFQLGVSPDSLKRVINDETCFPVDAGGRVVFGASPAAAPRVDAELKSSLGNSGPRSVLVGVGGEILDRVDYEETAEGVAWQIDPDGELCLAPLDSEYIDGNAGSPGEANPFCPLSLGPGRCFDEGQPRAIVSPGPGEARITEWMANPRSSDSRSGEWVEVRFDVSADMNGLSISDLASDGAPIEGDDCLEVPAGTHLLFARNTDPLENGGLEHVTAELPVSLNNSKETIRLSVDERVIDSVSYERSNAGVATQLDEIGNVCDATQGYGDGDLGTPGAANPPCA